MKVKRRLALNNAVMALSIGAVMVVLLVTTQRVVGAMEQKALATRLMTAQLERLALRTDYMRSGSERARLQTLAKSQQIGELLQAAAGSFSGPEGRKAVATLVAGQEAIDKIFRAILANRSHAGQGRPAELAAEVEDRLLSQLNMRVYEAVLYGGKLQQGSSAALVAALRSGCGWIALVLLLMGSASLINSRSLNRAIAERVTRLRLGAAAIGEGNLEHRIELEGEDEFTELARSFNEMSEKLSRSYQELARESEERREAQGARSESEERLRFALETCHIGAWDLDLVDHSAYRSPEHDRIFGYQALLPEWTLEMFLEHLLPEYRDQVEAMVREATAARTGWTCECRIRRADGEIRWIWFSGRYFADSSGRSRVIGVVYDTTERKQAEEALKASERKYRDLFNNMTEEVHFWQLVRDAAGGIRSWRLVDANPPSLATWGRTLEQIRGKTTDEIFGPGATEHFRWVVEKIMSEGAPHAFEDYFPHLDKYFRFTSVPLGEYFITTGADITSMRKAEQALQKAHDELALQMEERTRDLHDKEVLLKEVHHRVKNNLQVISSLVSLQADGLKDGAMQEALREVSYRVRSMALVHEKLYQSADLARVDFAEYAGSLLRYLWRAHGSAAGAIRLNLALEPVFLPVDCAVPCGLILNELAGNALKHAFLGRERGEVTVSLGRGPEGSVRLSVRDDGVGLPPGLDWRQADSLGLRLVQMLAGQLRAGVEMSSREGTEFRIDFRLPESGKGGTEHG